MEEEMRKMETCGWKRFVLTTRNVIFSGRFPRDSDVSFSFFKMSECRIGVVMWPAAILRTVLPRRDESPFDSQETVMPRAVESPAPAPPPPRPAPPRPAPSVQRTQLLKMASTDFFGDRMR